MNRCSPYREELGAHVLGGLEPDEVAALQVHLEHCAACRAEQEVLASTVPLLTLAESAPPRAPYRVRDRVIAAAARRRGRRLWMVGAAAAVLLAGLLGGFVGRQLLPVPPPSMSLRLQAVEPFEASGWVTFREEGGEVVVEVEIEDLQRLQDPGVYEAWLYEADERIVSIGQLAPVDGRTTVTLSAEGSLEQFRGFWVTAEPDRRDPAHEGETVVRAPVPQTR